MLTGATSVRVWCGTGGYLSQVAGTPADQGGRTLSRIARVVTALVLLVIVAGVAGLGAVGVLYARDDVRRHQSDAVRERAAVIASVVKDGLAGDVTALAATAGRRPFHLAVVSRQYPLTGPYLSELITLHPRFTAVAIYDGIGRLVVRIPYDPGVAGRRFGRQEYFAAAKSQGFAHISRLFVQLGRPKVPVIAFSIRIFHRSSVHGVLVATVPITSFDSLTASYIPAGWTARVYDAGGELVSPSNEASGRSYTSDPIVGPALQGRSVHRQVAGSLVAATPVDPYGWAVRVSEPKGPADAHLKTVTKRLSWYAGGATALALLGAIIAFVRRRPRTTEA